jgi:predicted DNA-binding antitoxin AbrB/MazE fold protein
MTFTVEATFEQGQLKFKEPLLLAEGTPVRVTITPLDEDIEVQPAPIHDHAAFLSSYAPEDEGLYDAYPPR